MLKRQPSRSQRSRGIKAKSVLQILLLLGICFWLIYQVKYSHDKKRELNEKDGNVVSKDSNVDILKYGRKELHPRVEETDKKDESREEEENVIDEEEVRQEGLEGDHKVQEKLQTNEAGSSEHDSGEEQEEAELEGAEQEIKKREDEEEQEEEEHKNEEIEDEVQGGEVGEMDDHDQEKLQGEADGEEELIDEDKEREEEGDDKESEINDEEDKEGHVDDEHVLEDEYLDEGNLTTHEAREEHYKGDDASSAVAHDNQINVDAEKLLLDDSNENLGINTTDDEQNTNANKSILEANIREDGIIKIGSHQNETANLNEDPELSTATVNGSMNLTGTGMNETLSQFGTRINSTGVDTGASNDTRGGRSDFSITSTLNATESKDSLQAQDTAAEGGGAGEISSLKTLNTDLRNDTNTTREDSVTTTSPAEVGQSSDFPNSPVALAEKTASSSIKEKAENNIKLPSELNENDGVTLGEGLKGGNETGSNQTG